MAVFTPLPRRTVCAVLEQHYSLGALQQYRATPGGTDNTSYFLHTSRGDFVFTLVESASFAAVRYYVGLCHHLAVQGFPCARPIPTRSKELISALGDKPVVVMNRLPGNALKRAQERHCRTIGTVLGALHCAAAGYPATLTQRTDDWCREHAEELRPFLGAADQKLLAQGLEELAQLPWDQLTQGHIHGDLFPDNALFCQGRLTGLIDFYHAATASYLYDIAVTLNAWCPGNGAQRLRRDTDCARQMLNAYRRLHTLSSEEYALLPLMRRIAALRFWLSRLKIRHLQPHKNPANMPNPEQMRDLYQQLPPAS